MIFTLLLMSASPEAEHQVQGAQRLDAVIGDRASILQLLASEDQAGLVRDVLERFAVRERASIIKVELVWRDALLVLDFRLDAGGRASILDFRLDVWKTAARTRGPLAIMLTRLAFMMRPFFMTPAFMGFAPFMAAFFMGFMGFVFIARAEWGGRASVYGRDVLLVLDFCLDVGNGVRGFDGQGEWSCQLQSLRRSAWARRCASDRR